MNDVMKADIVFLFGLSGSGKTYLGEALSKATGWPHYNADEDVTADMLLALSEHRPFTAQMRDDFFAIVVNKIRRLSAVKLPMIVSQAAYKQQHRDFVEQTLAPLKVEFIHVVADDKTLNDRLKNRRKAGAGIAEKSAQALKNDFEIPPQSCKKIDNSRSKNTQKQIEWIQSSLI